MNRLIAALVLAETFIVGASALAQDNRSWTFDVLEVLRRGDDDVLVRVTGGQPGRHLDGRGPGPVRAQELERAVQLGLEARLASRCKIPSGAGRIECDVADGCALVGQCADHGLPRAR